MSSDEAVRKAAIKFVKKNKKLIISKFADLTKFPPSQNPFTVFMAGSPGAGKTEFSISLIKQLGKKDPNTKVVRIDADEIRDIIPQYDKTNSNLLQSAAAIGVEKLFDHVQDHAQNVVVDGTFANYEVALKDVKRALGKNRKIGIIYLHQDPAIAWDFTKKREKLEGRIVPKEMFIQAFLNSKENVHKIKKEFGNDVRLSLVIKDFENRVEKTLFNIDNVDSYLKVKYNPQTLRRIL